MISSSRSSSVKEQLFQISYDQKFGRHLTARDDIEPVTVIIDEPPIVEGPSIDISLNSHSNVCPACYRKLTDDVKPGLGEETALSSGEAEDGSSSVVRSYVGVSCIKCSLLLCSTKCADSLVHYQNECQVFSTISELSLVFKDKATTLLCQFITTLRMLFFKYTSELKWKQILELQSHCKVYESKHLFDEIDEAFKLLSWELFRPTPLPGLIDERMTSEVDAENIAQAARRCLGVLRTNSFSQFTNEFGVEKLYFFSSFMSHSCLMNTERYFSSLDEDDERRSRKNDLSPGQMVTKSARRIKRGEQITTTYLSYLVSTNERQEDMKRIWNFSCTCERCVDPEECGSCLSTIKCPDCSLVSLNPFYSEDDDGKVRWSCKNDDCAFSTIDPHEIDLILANAIMPIEVARPKLLIDLDEVENWLDQFDSGQLVHTCHSIFIQVKYFLGEFYGHGCENGVAELTDERLLRKALYSKQTLSVMEKLFQGVYLFKGVAMFHLWLSLREVSARFPHSASLSSKLNATDSSTSTTHQKMNLQQFFDDISDLRSEVYMQQLGNQAYDILKHGELNSCEELMANLLFTYKN